MGKHQPSTACKRGHTWTEGSYTFQRGYKACLVCRRARYWAKYRASNLERHERERQRMTRWKKQEASG